MYFYLWKYTWMVDCIWCMIKDIFNVFLPLEIHLNGRLASCSCLFRPQRTDSFKSDVTKWSSKWSSKIGNDHHHQCSHHHHPLDFLSFPSATYWQLSLTITQIRCHIGRRWWSLKRGDDHHHHLQCPHHHSEIKPTSEKIILAVKIVDDFQSSASC